MLYDNTQFILLLSKYCKIDSDNYFKNKLSQTIEFLKKNFVNKEGFLGSAYDADSDGEEGKYYVYNYDEIKDIENIFLDDRNINEVAVIGVNRVKNEEIHLFLKKGKKLNDAYIKNICIKKTLICFSNYFN